MTGWMGTLYLVDSHGRDHVARVLLPGPLSLSRDRIAGLDLPDGFALRGIAALNPVDGPVPEQAVLTDLHPHSGRVRQTALAVEEIAFESPPSMSDDLPCPARLEQALLPGGKGSRLYLLFDAARLAPLLRVFEPSDLAADRPAAALFLSEGMARQSPWLVDVTPDEVGTTPRLMRQFLRSAWNQRAGIFLRSNAGFDEIFRFLRGFTRVHDGADDDKTILLRFWDPVVARHWFAAQGQDPARVARLFWTPSGAPLEILGETGATGFFRLSPSALTPEANIRRGLLTLGDTDRCALQDATMVTLGRELSAWAMSARPERFAGFTHRRLAAMEAHVVAVGQQYGLRRKEDFAALLNLMLQLGGWFHQGGAAPELVEMLKTGGARLAERLIAELARIMPQLPQGRIAARWPAIQAGLAAVPPQARLDADAFRDLAAAIGPAEDPRLAAIVQAALRDVAGLGLSRHETGVVLALTLIYGHRYYDDPMRDWGLVSGAEKDGIISLSARLWPQPPTEI